MGKVSAVSESSTTLRAHADGYRYIQRLYAVAMMGIMPPPIKVKEAFELIEEAGAWFLHLPTLPSRSQSHRKNLVKRQTLSPKKPRHGLRTPCMRNWLSQALNTFRSEQA